MVDLTVVTNLISMALEMAEEGKDDEVMNSLITAKQFISHFEDKFFAEFKSAWDSTIRVMFDNIEHPPTERYFARVDDEGVLTLPDGLLEKMGWSEGTVLNLEVTDDNTLVITEATDNNA
jgi:hypothetical protein